MFQRGFLPFWIAFVAYLWWLAAAHRLDAVLSGQAMPLSAGLAATVAAAGHLAGNAIEALFYRWWWGFTRDIRLSFLRLFEAFVSISLLDVLAGAFRSIGRMHAF